MKQTIERLSGGVAWAMTGLGPRPVLAPPDETGNDGGSENGDNAGGDNGGGNQNDGGDNGAGDKGDGGSRTGKLGGLFGQRGKAGDGGSSEENGGDAQPGADGRPAGLADKYWDADKKQVRLDALIKANTDTEKAFRDLKRAGSIGGEVPEDASGYFKDGITVPETADRFTSLTADDPGVKAFADVCKARGIGKDMAAAIMSDMLVAMNEHQPVPVDMEQEMKSLGKGGPALVDGLFTWFEGMERAGQMSGADIDVVERIGQTADGIRFLAKIRNLTGEQPIPVDPGVGVRGMSLDQLDAQYKEAVKKGDYAEQERLDALRAKINPDGQAPGISGRQGGYSI